MAIFVLDVPFWAGIILGVSLVAVGTCGDLIESMIKRDLGIKDMSSFLPGHGGVMDRLDSLLVAAPSSLADHVSSWFRADEHFACRDFEERTTRLTPREIAGLRGASSRTAAAPLGRPDARPSVASTSKRWVIAPTGPGSCLRTTSKACATIRPDWTDLPVRRTRRRWPRSSCRGC